MRLLLIVFSFICKISLPAQTLTSSPLPIVLLETNGQTIRDEPKITAAMKIISGAPGQINQITDTPSVYNGTIGIEIRGKSSSGYPQTPYGVETRDAAGNNLDVSIFGWPKDNDWILLSNYNDRSLLRNMLSFNLFRAMGHYAPRCRLVEVVLNDDYRGIYLFCEKIKRGTGRVDIAKLEPSEISGDDLTGGYQFKADYWSVNDFWVSNFSAPDYPGKSIRFVYEYPAPKDLVQAQRNYLSNYVHTFEKVLFGADFRDTLRGYAPFIEVGSFIDYLIVQEVSRNIDGFKKSSFFYKDKESKDGRIHAGPVWDFDWAWKNIDECSIFAATNGAGYAHQINSCRGDLPAPGWFPRLLEDTAFSNRLQCRYRALRQGPLATATIHHWMDSMAASVSTAQIRHFQRWNILGINTSTPEVPPIPTSYNGEINKLKTWIDLRLRWLDNNMPGRCGADTDPEEPEPGLPHLKPNPAYDLVELQYRTPEMYQFLLFDVTGRQVSRLRQFDEKNPGIDVSGLSNGIYFLQPIRSNGKKTGKSFKFIVLR